jgi:hypothetical protein
MRAHFRKLQQLSMPAGLKQRRSLVILHYSLRTQIQRRQNSENEQ